MTSKKGVVTKTEEIITTTQLLLEVLSSLKMPPLTGFLVLMALASKNKKKENQHFYLKFFEWPCHSIFTYNTLNNFILPLSTKCLHLLFMINQ